MSNRKVVCFIAFGAAAVTLAGYSAYAQRSNRALQADLATGDFFEPQTSNRAAKAGKLPVQSALQAIENKPVYALASAMPGIDFSRFANPALDAALTIPSESAPDVAAAPATATKPAAVASAPLPEKAAEKPKKPVLPPAPAASNGVLDDGQITGLKGRLRLTSDQAEYWPAVEAALRDVVRTQMRGSIKHAGKPSIDVNSAEVQKLIWAAMPLLMRLREDQKSEVRKLARVIGLEQVASQI